MSVQYAHSEACLTLAVNNRCKDCINKYHRELYHSKRPGSETKPYIDLLCDKCKDEPTTKYCEQCSDQT